MRNIATFIVSVVMLLTHVCGDQQDNYVDPTDLINFDPVAVRMRKVSKVGMVYHNLKE